MTKKAWSELIRLVVNMYVVLRVHILKLNIGDWSNGMIGVSKTFGGSSILSSPAINRSEMLDNIAFPAFLFFFMS